MPDTTTADANFLTGESDLRRKADGVIETAAERAQTGLETARSGAHSAVAQTEEAVTAAREYIQRHASDRPLATVAIAAGAGMLLALLLRR